MESLVSLPFILLTVPNLKIRKPAWCVKPSPMLLFTLALFSYFLVTAGQPHPHPTSHLNIRYLCSKGDAPCGTMHASYSCRASGSLLETR